MKIHQSVSKRWPHSKPHEGKEAHEKESKVEPHVNFFLKHKVNSDECDLFVEENNVEHASFPVFSHDVVEHASEEEAGASVLGAYDDYDD